jgi:hypothetical protein
MENVGIFHAHLYSIYVAVWNKLWPFGIVSGHLVYFPVMACFGQKIRQPCRHVPTHSSSRVFFFIFFFVGPIKGLP